MSEVIYLSAASAVDMADEWYDVAHREHFWIKRRFDVLRYLARGIDLRNKRIGEIGCGTGLVQQQFAEQYGVQVDGFDLNEYALRHSVAADQPRYCYDIFDCRPELAGRYDVLVLFDVLEHIEQEKPFLEKVLFHLKPGGLLFVNVPAFMAFYSRYDEVLGHHRRYTLAQLDRSCSAVGLEGVARTYWGLPIVPLLLLRKLWVKGQTDPALVTRRGYQPPSHAISAALSIIAKLEPIPQRLLGTSVMAFYRKPQSR
jgi:2-polyprenyl-3-methyl-5-hydroxy-6-metoxy-1,4-benzoquinol methylase